MTCRTGIAIVLAAAVGLTGISGCATGDGEGAVIPSGGDDCFWASSIHSWKALDDETLIVWSPSRSCPYLVELTRRCFGIRFTEDLGFYDRDGRICPYGGDAVIVPGPAGDRCSIASIKRLTPDELDMLLDEESTDDDPPSEAGECNPNTDPAD